MPDMQRGEGRAQGNVAPRVFGKFALGLDRSPLEVTQVSVRVKGPFLRALAGKQTIPVGSGIRIESPECPAWDAVVIEHFELPEGDYYILDWRSARQPVAVELT